MPPVSGLKVKRRAVRGDVGVVGAEQVALAADDQGVARGDAVGECGAEIHGVGVAVED